MQQALAERVLETMSVPAPYQEWLTRMMVRYVVSSVLEWIEVGEASRDDAFVELATAGLQAMVAAWAKPADSSAAA